MADQLSGFIVVTETDISEVDAGEMVCALKMIKGVIDVKPVTKEPLENRVVRSRVVAEVKDIILKKLNEM
jgi:hypothetical protein